MNNRRTVRESAQEALLDPAEFFFQLAEIHLDQSGPSVRAGVRHDTMPQIFNELLQLRTSQWIVCFDRMAADGLGNCLFVEAPRIHARANCLQFINQFQNEAPGVWNLDKWGQRIQQKRSLPEVAQANAQACERGHLLTQKLRVSR